MQSGPISWDQSSFSVNILFQIFRLGQQSLREFTTGQVMDLVSNDVQRIEELPFRFFRIWLSLFDVGVTACLMWYFVGWQALVGLAFMLLLVPFFGYLSHISGKLRKKTAALTDRRVLLMTEIVSAIRVVKINAWEWIYRDKTRDIRR